MNEEHVRELLSDKAFVKSLLEIETVERIQAAFQAKGAELSTEEVNAICAPLKEGADEGMSLDELESVAGGLSFKLPIEIGKPAIPTPPHLPGIKKGI